MTRYCPNCRAVVPRNSLNCPQCLTDVPREGWVEDGEPYVPTKAEYRENIDRRHKSFIAVMILAVFPAFLGLLGLGHIYRDSHDKTGWIILATGLVLAILVPLLAFGSILTGPFMFLVLPLAVLFALAYLALAVASILDALTGGFFSSRLHL